MNQHNAMPDVFDICRYVKQLRNISYWWAVLLEAKFFFAEYITFLHPNNHPNNHPT